MVHNPSAWLQPFDRHGLITTRVLRSRGLSYEQILLLARDGELQRLLHGVYRDPHAPVPPTQPLALPLVYLDQRRRSGHASARVSGGPALAIRGLAPPSMAEASTVVLVDEACRARAGHLPFTTCRVRGPGPMADEEMGLRFARVGRCLADAAADEQVTGQALRVAADMIRNERRMTMTELVATWPSARHAGAIRLAAMLAAGDFEQESEGERHVFKTVFTAFPPQPDCQVVLLGVLRVDFVFINAGLVIEYLGQSAHAGRLEADATRTHALEAAGYRVITITRHMLRNPARLAEYIHAIRRDREQRIACGALPRPPLPVQPPRLHPLRTLYPQG